MAISKITKPSTPIEEVDKINELVDGVNDAGTVKKVNNTSPDSNGNVTLSIPDAQVQSDWNQTTTTAKDYIKNKPTIPTVNNATLTITQGGVSKGTFTANASSNVTIALDAGGGTATDVKINSTSITSNGVADIKTNGTYNASSNKIATMSDIPSLSGYLQNTATGTGALTINGTASAGSYAVNIGSETTSTANYGTAIGYKSKATASSSTAIGRVATSGGAYSIAMGYGATVSSTGGKSIQLGYGTNSTATSLSVGFQDVGNYQLLDGSTGLIPDARISSNIARTSAIPTVNNATLTITQGGTTKGTFTANASSNVTIDLDAGGGASRNIGEIIVSTIPLTDAGLHLLDGALISGSGSYSAFVTYIAGLYNSGDYTAIFDTEANWQTSVTTYGVCGKFVYDSTNNTVRLPKIIGIIEGTIDESALGDLVEAGLPDHTHTVPAPSSYAGSGLGYEQWYGKNSTNTFTSSFASESNSIYGNSNTVQPQTIKVLYYIVIATSSKTEIEVDIDEIATDLNGKADTDLSNVNNTAKSIMSTMGMPSDTYEDLTLGATGTSYTAPADGWVCLNKKSSAAGQYVQISYNNLALNSRATGSNQNSIVMVPVRKGRIYYVHYTTAGDTISFKFYYAKGSEWEA